MKRGYHMLQLLTEAADLPQEVLPDTPLVELTDERRVLVENHGGITEFEPELIRVRVRFGTLAVHGRCLCIAKMSAKQLVITGRIDGVTLERKGTAK